MTLESCKVVGFAVGLVVASVAGMQTAPAQSADPGKTREQVAALPAADSATVTLPDVSVFGSYLGANGTLFGLYPGTNGAEQGPRASSSNTVRTQHFRVWSGYDSQLAMHPYTSHMGPCPEGNIGTGCNRTTGTLIPHSGYERPPFTN